MKKPDLKCLLKDLLFVNLLTLGRAGLTLYKQQLHSILGPKMLTSIFNLVAISLNQFKWQFCSGFLVMSAYYIKAQFQVCHKYELVNFAFWH